MLLTIGFLCWLYSNRFHDIVAFASPFMCALVLIGAILCYLSCILMCANVLHHDILCTVREVAPNMSFTMLWASIMLKLSRTYQAAVKTEARPSLIPSLCTHFTRAGIEWRR